MGFSRTPLRFRFRRGPISIIPIATRPLLVSSLDAMEIWADPPWYVISPLCNEVLAMPLALLREPSADVGAEIPIPIFPWGLTRKFHAADLYGWQKSRLRGNVRRARVPKTMVSDDGCACR